MTGLIYFCQLKLYRMQKALRLLPIALCSLLLLVGCGKKDKSARYISKDAVGIISINTTQLIKKVGLDMLFQSPMFKEMSRSTGADSTSFNLEATGIQYLATVYAYALPDQRLSSKSKFMAVIPLKDAGKLAAFIKKQFKEAKVETKDKLTLATLNNNICVGWDKNTLIVAAAPPHNEWSEQDQSYSEVNNTTILTEEIQKAFAMPEDQSMAGNKNFGDLVKAGHDISFWLNYESLMNNLPQEQLGTPGTIMASQKKLVKDAYMAGGVNFENGKITGDATYYFNPTVKAVAEALEVKSANDDLLKKVQGKQLNLMMSYHINPQGIKTLIDTLGVMPYVAMGLKDYGLTLDDILNAFSGDFLLAVTDFSVATESQSYTLGGSSVNYTKPVPSFKATLSFKVKDKAAFDKLLQAAVGQQILTSSAPNVYTAGFLNLATNGAYAVISNEAAVAGAYLAAPGNASFPVPSEVKNSPYSFYMDIKNSIQAVPLDLLYGKQDTGVFHDGKNLLEAISAHGGKVKGDHSDFHFEATFVNKKENSLLQLIKFGQKVKKAEEKEGDSYNDIIPEADSMSEEELTDTAVEAI